VPDDLSQLNWVPTRLLYRALERLTFTIRRIVGGDNVLDARLEYESCCKFVSIEQMVARYERWVFETPSGKSIHVFGVEAIEAIASSFGSYGTHVTVNVNLRVRPSCSQ
jgi:hypothetical protein